MEKNIDTERLYGALKSIVINTLVNEYAVERVAFGYEKPGDKVPVDLYLKDLHLNTNDAVHKHKDICGIYIDERECISAEQDYSGYVRDLFVTQMESIFINAPKDERLERAGEELPLKPRFREYVFGLLPLFTEILNVEVEYDAFDLITTDSTMDYDKWQRFVTAILLKPLRTGSRIDRYVKDITNAPYYIRRLIEKKGNGFYLKTADVNGCEYIYALFSLMKFMNAENGKLLELKMRKRERLRP